ncbi:hypothetical protein BJX76DRAFT_360935 [Aspergillus varians]
MPANTPLEADYVIGGGGTAGLVLVSRLSEDPNTSIIVLEVGKDLTQDSRIQIPALQTTLIGSDKDWQFQSIPQPSVNGRVIKSPEIETKTRSFAAIGHGVPAAKQGVQIVTEALVNRILFDAASNNTEITASGVEAPVHGQFYNIQARKEVILCAGALNSPKLLELSGIGNEDLLHQFDIPTTIHNPHVSERLQDHLSTAISFEAVDDITTLEPPPPALMPILDFHPSNTQRTTTTQDSIDTFLPPTPDARTNAIRNILSHQIAATCMMFMYLAQANLHKPQGNSFTGPLHPGNFLSLGFLASHPFSRGSVHIASSDPAATPILDPRYLSHPLDLDIMTRNLLEVQKLHRVSPLSTYLKPNGRRNHPDAYIASIDAVKRCLVDTATTAFHYRGTVAMLPREKGGVVDERLVVYGTRNLRVCDASVFPLIPAANIQATVYAVAERAADIIRGRV